MQFVSIYGRVLGLLKPERRLAIMLALANVGLAGVGFLEPLLFGRIIDVLAMPPGSPGTWEATIQLLLLWAAAGMTGIVAGIMVALHADRLAHRRRLAALASYFEHVLSLPVAFHAGTHSATLLKIMLQGGDNLFGMWLSFFREHLSTFVAVLVLLPLSLYLNWRLGILLVVLIFIFAGMSAFVVHKAQRAQGKVEAYYSELATRAYDALGNVVLVQSFVRLALEARDLAGVMERLLAAQFPVLNLWALMTVLSRMAATITTIGPCLRRG